MLPVKFVRRSLAGAIALLLIAAQAFAATKTWTGNAAAVTQISTLTVAGTWATTETATLTVNGKAIVVTIGANTTTANVATALKEAWMSGARLDGSASTDATSNTGGAQFGEFAEMSATVSGSVVTLIGVTPGKPITLSVAETAAAGTLTLATPQVATGSHHWDNAKNWDTGTVPANDDTVVFRDSDVSCWYGLPNGSLEVTFNVYQNFSGQIGLAAINRDDTARPYYEYRQRYVRLDDSGAGTNIAHRFGIGRDGPGSSLINLKHTLVKCSPIVYNTGAPRINGTKALNICCTTNTSTLNILEGSVEFSSQDGGTSAFVAVTQTAGDARGVSGVQASAVVTCSGGKMLIGGSGGIDTIQVRDGVLQCEDQTGTITTLNIFKGTVEYSSTGTISTLAIYGGTFDGRTNSGGFTVTNGRVFGGKFLDPFKRMTIGTNFVLYFEPSESLQFGTYFGDGMDVNP